MNDTPHHAAGSDASGNHRTRRRRILHRVLIGVVALLAVLAVLGLWLYHSDPGYWIENQQFLTTTEPKKLKAMARDVESRVLRLQSYQAPNAGVENQTGTSPNDSAPQDPSIRIMRMTIEQANAWLSTMLPKWLANRRWQMPSQISQPTVHVDDQDLILGFKWDSPEISNVFSIVLGVSHTDDGLISVQRKAIYWGRLPMPYSFFLDHLKKRSSRKQRELVKWLTEISDGVPQQVAFPYSGDTSRKMQLRLVEFQLDQQTVELTMRLEPVDESLRTTSVAPIPPIR